MTNNKGKTNSIAVAGAKSKTKSAAKNSVPATEFILQAPDAKEVFVTGSFNGWSVEDGYKLRRFKDGVWKKKLKLEPGRYEYQFVVDGTWWADPQNPERVESGFGSHNSVIEVK